MDDCYSEPKGNKIQIKKSVGDHYDTIMRERSSIKYCGEGVRVNFEYKTLVYYYYLTHRSSIKEFNILNEIRWFQTPSNPVLSREIGVQEPYQC
jgi:hypothetical protein